MQYGLNIKTQKDKPKEIKKKRVSIVTFEAMIIPHSFTLFFSHCKMKEST